MTTATLTNNRWAQIGLVSAFWVGVGLIGGSAIWVADRMAGTPIRWGASLRPALGAALLWIPITLTAIWLSRRFPPQRDRWLPALLVHGGGAALVSFTLNGAFNVVYGLLYPSVTAPSGLAMNALQMGIRWWHINAAVYLAIVAVVATVDRNSDANAARRGRPAGRASGGSRGSSGAGSGHGGDRAATASSNGYLRQLRAGAAGKITLLEVADIDWIEGAGDYAEVHAGGREVLVSERLKVLEAKLDPKRFVRIHRSRIVNLDRVRELRHHSHGDYVAVLEDGTELRVSRARRKAVFAAIEERS